MPSDAHASPAACEARNRTPTQTEQWDARYRERLAEGRDVEAPHPFLLAVAHDLPARGRALDIAAGFGRHALWLAARGLDVVAVDISPIACDHLQRTARDRSLALTVLCRDLERQPLPPGPFDVIVNILYLQRDLAPAIEDHLAPGGLLLFSTMVEGGVARSSGHHDYHLRRGELPALFPRLTVLRFEEQPPTMERPHASLLARKPSALRRP